MESKIRQIMADILDLAPGSITDETGMDNTGSWDSLAHINLMTALEHEFGITLDIEEIEAMRSFSDIRGILRHKLCTHR